MGQYYTPTLISEDGSIRILSAHDYNNGLKLMEHSYVGNDFVNAVLTFLWKIPCRLAWIGDYSDYICGDPYEAKFSHETFMRCYEAAWGDNRENLIVKPKPRNIMTMRSKRRYLVNHTKHCYINVGEYIAKNKWTRVGAWSNHIYDPYITYEMCINPLPLLTACGNGRGLGDYHKKHPCYSDVGTWAFDFIEVTDKRPADYEKANFTFTEQNYI